MEAAQAVLVGGDSNLHIGQSVVQSVASVISRHIMTAAGQNRQTQFLVSLPLPITLIHPMAATDDGQVRLVGELRRSFRRGK